MTEVVPTTTTRSSAAVDRLRAVARHPRGYIDGWRDRNPGRKVVGLLPMNFPREIAQAAGLLTVIVPDDQVPITEGRALLAEFYCGYTRNLADQAATGRFDAYDALYLADHCIQLVGAADVVRAVLPETPVYFGMLNSALDDAWAFEQVCGRMAEFRAEFAELSGQPDHRRGPAGQHSPGQPGPPAAAGTAGRAGCAATRRCGPPSCRI